jgi:tRNA threonylcarbamoyladenosine biosynthesis protein TsaE
LNYASKEIADQAGEVQAEDKNNKRRKQFGNASDKKSNHLIKIGFHFLSPSSACAYLNRKPAESLLGLSRIHPPDIIPQMSILDAHTMDFFSRGPEQTRRIGMRLGGALQAGDVICLQGDLGAGKTTFVQGIARGWGSLDSVSSPTFIIVNVYRRGDEARLFHMDAYRLDSTPEAEELDLDSMLAQGPLLIEWPERMDGLVPAERLWVSLEHIDEEERQMKFKATGQRYDNLLEVIRHAAYGGD